MSKTGTSLLTLTILFFMIIKVWNACSDANCEVCSNPTICSKCYDTSLTYVSSKGTC